MYNSVCKGVVIGRSARIARHISLLMFSQLIECGIISVNQKLQHYTKISLLWRLQNLCPFDPTPSLLIKQKVAMTHPK